jgi:hypothetical protein
MCVLLAVPVSSDVGLWTCGSRWPGDVACERVIWCHCSVQMAKSTRPSSKHEILARYEHGPSTMISGLGRHEHDYGLC